VTPDGGPAQNVDSGSVDNGATLIVKNGTTLNQTFTISCYGTGAVTCTGLDATQLNILAGHTSDVTAFFNAGAPGSGKVVVRANGSSAGWDTGYVNILVVSPPPPPAPAVTISIPHSARPGATCTWFADVTGGVAPFTYQWSGFGTGTLDNTTVTLPPGGGNLIVDVWDSYSPQRHTADTLFVTEDVNAPICNQ